ncbi:DUF3558 family protein [Amycolatopsis sp. 195334CR]|uniref:DUF3558 family protein n=1 Tax=Amycolatopsis sp. 195334CR TaxID=2814588 RepID=UPI001A8D07B3|nr:DUF3558 family protein [Amycolatopsis sp. 195334CR]MBN6037627.1 DUF3558 domain-containing protein [Amycolatopsis sp. 195334CR]
MLSLRTLVIPMLALAFLAACTVEGPGNSVTVPAEPPAAESTGSSPSPRDIFAGVQVCEVLDGAVAGQGFPPGKFSDIGSDNGCRVEKTGISLGMSLDDKQGIDDFKVDPSKRFSGEVNGRRAFQVKEPLGEVGDCQVAVDMGANARFIITVALGSNRPTDEACAQATKTAQVVEPELPKG